MCISFFVKRFRVIRLLSLFIQILRSFFFVALKRISTCLFCRCPCVCVCKSLIKHYFFLIFKFLFFFKSEDFFKLCFQVSFKHISLFNISIQYHIIYLKFQSKNYKSNTMVLFVTNFFLLLFVLFHSRGLVCTVFAVGMV